MHTLPRWMWKSGAADAIRNMGSIAVDRTVHGNDRCIYLRSWSGSAKPDQADDAALRRRDLIDLVLINLARTSSAADFAAWGGCKVLCILSNARCKVGWFALHPRFDRQIVRLF